MSGFLNDNSRLYLGVILLICAIGTFIYGWIQRSNGHEFDQLWMLSVVMLFGASVHLQRIGGKKHNGGKDE